MKIEEYNAFKYIHDNAPNVKYALCVYVVECDRGLYIKHVIESDDNLSIEDLKKIVIDQFWMYDYEIDEICVKVINYSELIEINDVRDLLTVYPSTYDCIIVDFHN